MTPPASTSRRDIIGLRRSRVWRLSQKSDNLLLSDLCVKRLSLAHPIFNKFSVVFGVRCSSREPVAPAFDTYGFQGKFRRRANSARISPR